MPSHQLRSTVDITKLSSPPNRRPQPPLNVNLCVWHTLFCNFCYNFNERVNNLPLYLALHTYTIKGSKALQHSQRCWILTSILTEKHIRDIIYIIGNDPSNLQIGGMNMKKFVFFVATLLLLGSVTYACEPTIEYEGICNDTISWTLDSAGTLSIIGTGRVPDYDMPFYAHETYEEPTTLSPWYDYRSKIKTAIVSEGITELGERTFWTCPNLTAVMLPSSLTRIGTSAFYYDISLTKITIPSSVTVIEEHAFKMSGVQSVEISSKELKIEEYAFRCENANIIYYGTSTEWQNLDIARVGNKFQSITFIQTVKVA